jgi:hypothetical protein
MFIDFPEITIPVQGLDKVYLPKMVTVRQRYDPEHIEDVAAHVRQRLEEHITDKSKYKGKRLCITVGSRGIPHLAKIVRTICDVLKTWGAKPFIVPAMGSHGGATAEGQREMLEGYGVTAEAMDVPLLSSMEVVQYGELDDGTPLYCDKNAWESDGIIIFNKVKPHTDYRGTHESGIAKMIAIGLAKHKGCSVFHMKGFAAFPIIVPQAARIFLKAAPVAFGIGLVQNAYDEIRNIEVCTSDKLLELDANLQAIAKENIANFKFKKCDVLIIDEIGKNISGNGHDPNVVGRNNSGDFPGVFSVQRVFIRSLTKETHHNGCGLSGADITTRRCLNDVDWVPTWINVVSANRLNGGRIPVYVNTDREALKLAIKTCDNIDFSYPKIARIKNTLFMTEIEVSESLYEEIKDFDGIELVEGPHDITFDAAGFMTSIHYQKKDQAVSAD